MTREELMVTTTDDLRKVASEMGIKNASSFNKISLIDKILMAQEESTQEESTQYTDRHLKPVAINQRVNARIGWKWYPGVITRLKMIAGEGYASILLDGNDKSKLFSSVDFEILKEETQASPSGLESNLPSKEKGGGKSRVEKSKPLEKSGPSKTDQIRVLLKEGKKPSEIAKDLGVRPQFIYTVKKKYSL